MNRLSSFYWNVIYRNDQSLSLRWIAPLCAGLTLMPVLGSAVSGGIIVAAAIAWFALLVHPTRILPLAPNERLYAQIAIAYAVIALATAFASEHAGEALKATASYLGFLLIFPILPVLRYYQDEYWDQWIRYSIAAGSILAGLWAVGEVVWFRNVRAEALTGNALIFAYLAGVWGLMNGWIALYARGAGRILHLTAAVSGLIAILLSASRAPLLFFLLVGVGAFFVGIAVNRAVRLRRPLLKAITLAGAATLTYLALAQTLAFQRIMLRLQARFDVMYDGLANVISPAGGADANLEMRLAMLKGGFRAFLDRPFFGYGRQNVIDVAGRYGGGEAFPFTHLHNAYLTEMVASGMIGLAAFLAVLCLPLVVVRRSSSFTAGMAGVVVAFTALYSVTNIGFSHDIKLFSYCIVIIALAVLANRGSIISPSQAADYARFLSTPDWKPVSRNN